MILDDIRDRISDFGGKIGIYYMDLTAGRDYQIGNCDVFLASGSVKVFTLLEAFRRMEEGRISKDDTYVLKKEDYIINGKIGLKSFGALEYIHPGIELTIEDLYKFSTSVSDNIAFNILLKLFGTDEINKTLDMLGFTRSRVNRAIMDMEKRNKAIENYVSIEEMATLLYRMYKGQLISKKASGEMIEIMKGHQRDSIMGYYFNEDIQIAHQTGYDENLIMDMGIVFAENPFVLVMAAEDVNTRNAESIMRDITLMCYRNSNL